MTIQDEWREFLDDKNATLHAAAERARAERLTALDQQSTGQMFADAIAGQFTNHQTEGEDQ